MCALPTLGDTRLNTFGFSCFEQFRFSLVCLVRQKEKSGPAALVSIAFVNHTWKLLICSATFGYPQQRFVCTTSLQNSDIQRWTVIDERWAREAVIEGSLSRYKLRPEARIGSLVCNQQRQLCFVRRKRASFGALLNLRSIWVQNVFVATFLVTSFAYVRMFGSCASPRRAGRSVFEWRHLKMTRHPLFVLAIFRNTN